MANKPKGWLDVPEIKYETNNIFLFLQFPVIITSRMRMEIKTVESHTLIELDPVGPPPIPSFEEDVPLCTQRVTLHKISLVKNLWKDSVSFCE